VLIGEAYCDADGASRLAAVGPPSKEDIDIPLPRLPREGSSRPDGKPEGGPTDADAPRIGGGPKL
jgi:hypothetical protein